MGNDGKFETWSVELDTDWLDSNGTGCKADHRVKVDLIRNGKLCKDLKFPHTAGTPSDAKDSFAKPRAVRSSVSATCNKHLTIA